MEQINFSQHITPQPIEVVQNASDNKYVLYGQDNLYPNFLLKLFNESPLHKGITNSKVDYIKGDGLIFRGGDEIKIKPNFSDTFEQFSQKIILDYIIFNAFAVEVIYNKLGLPIQWVHVPINKVRINRSKSKFWYSNDWFNESNNTITYDRWIGGNNKDLKSKIFYHQGYSPSVNNIYPIPTYSGAIKSLETDIAIRDFHINNIENSFSVSSIITFFSGKPNDETAKIISNKITNSYTGSGNAGKHIIDYAAKDGQAADVKTLAPNDWDKAFDLLKKDTLQDILVAHSATSPLLFGIKTEGQLGGATELEVAYEIFLKLFVKGKRDELESAINKLFSDAGQAEMEFKDSGSLFQKTLSEATKEKIFTINELRIEGGKEPLVDGDRLISEPKNTPVEPNKFSENTPPDINKIKHLGLKKEEFHVFKTDLFHAHNIQDAKVKEMEFSDASDINDYLLSGENISKTLEDIKKDIRKELGIYIELPELQAKIYALVSDGKLDISNEKAGVISIKPISKPVENIRRVEVRYSYDVRKGLGDLIIPNTRDFCRTLLAEDKYYTRTEIQDMGAIFGYDIFTHTGGWYFNPNTQKSTNYCRHKWTAHSVVKK